MHGILVFGVVVLAGFTVTSARPSRLTLSPLCQIIKRNGCPSELKQTGKVCGTDGQTYRNMCLLTKKGCKLSLDIRIAYSAPCVQQQQGARPQQQAGGTAGEETVIGAGDNERGDTPDGRDTPDGNDAPDAQEAPDAPDAQDQDTPDTPDTPDQEDPGAQAYPDAGDPTEAPEPTEIPDAEPTQAPSKSSGSMSGSSSEETGAGGGAGGAGGAGAGGTMAPPLTSQPPLSPGAKVCPDTCPKPLKRDLVCGTDGQNYASVCLLRQHVCQTNETVAVLHRGLCNNTCGPECPMVYEPVCGTDDLTYMSRCDLVRTACLTQDDTLQVAYNQECAGVAQLKGCPECDPIPDPVCSTNNMTFRSPCEFDRFVCIFDVRGIEIAYNDSCPNAPLICPNYCEQIDDPVCGSDGVTYSNVCELGVADCHAKDADPTAAILFESFGPCPEGTPDPCSPDSPDCELYEDPVCAMKGKEMISYYNRCFYEKEVCFDPTIKFVSEGKCIPAGGSPAKSQIEPVFPKKSPTV